MTRRPAVFILGGLGAGVLVLIGLLGWLEAMSAKEAAGWALAGFMALREIISKIENVALNKPTASEGEV
jgi:urea transporter